MKKVNKFLALILSIVSFGSMAMLSACQSGGNKPFVPENPTEDTENHGIEGMLHKVSVTESNLPFVTAGTTEYKIVYDAKNYYKETASNFIIDHVKKATGAKIGVLAPENATWNENQKYIVVGDKALFESAGLTMPKDDIGQTGYFVKTVGKSVFIMTKGNDGYQLGAIAFLRAVLGYDMFAEDCVIYEKSGETLPTMNIVERPDYDYRQNSNKMISDTIYGMGHTAENEIWIPVGGSKIHNSFHYFPLEKYLEEHSDWYSDDTTITDRIGEERGQLCYTAHGNPTEYEAMVDTATEAAIYAIQNASNPNARNMSLTIQDNPTSCNCDECKKYLDKYGCISSTVIRFMNDLDDKVQAWLEEEAKEKGTEKREINFVFFAYYATEMPPAKKLADGTFAPIDDEVVCNDHVGVYIAPIKAKYNVSFYDEKNRPTADNIRGWGACSKLVYLWLYQTNFNHYLYPLNNYDVIMENYRFGKENNAVFIYDEGQLNQSTTTHFTRLKDYLSSKTEFDLNCDVAGYIDKYFKYYFREGAESMRAYFNELQAYLRYVEEVYSEKITGSIRDNMASTEIWKQATLEGWMDNITDALNAVEKYKVTSPETYEMLVNHIKIESVFLRYALCTLYEGMYDEETLYTMRKTLRDDCIALGVERSAEWTLINSTFTSWGL